MVLFVKKQYVLLAQNLRGSNLKEQSFGICPYLLMNGTIYVLLNRTSKSSYYNFFKGKTEFKEKPEDTAIREFNEETGVKVNREDLEDYYFQVNPNKNIGIYLVSFSKYKDYTFDFNKNEIWSAAWVSLATFIDMSKNQQQILENIKKHFMV